MAAAKPTAASGTDAPCLWLKVYELCTPGAETSTGWRSSISPDRCLQAWLMAAGKGGCLGSNWHAVVLCSPQPLIM